MWCCHFPYTHLFSRPSTHILFRQLVPNSAPSQASFHSTSWACKWTQACFTGPMDTLSLLLGCWDVPCGGEEWRGAFSCSIYPTASSLASQHLLFDTPQQCLICDPCAPTKVFNGFLSFVVKSSQGICYFFPQTFWLWNIAKFQYSFGITFLRDLPYVPIWLVCPQGTDLEHVHYYRDADYPFNFFL